MIIACGALANEITALKRANQWTDVEVQCLPPELHNRPERIVPAIREQLREKRAEYATVFIAYADCGTGGMLDALLREEQLAVDAMSLHARVEPGRVRAEVTLARAAR